MKDNIRGREAGTQSWVNELEGVVRSGSNRSRRALAELSTMALGGNREAQVIVNKLDNDISSHKLSLPPEIDDTGHSSSNLADDVIFALTHPVEAVRTKASQIMVSVEHEAPPFTSTIEDFPNLSLRDAASSMRAAQPQKKISMGLLPPDRDPGDF